MSEAIAPFPRRTTRDSLVEVLAAGTGLIPGVGAAFDHVVTAVFEKPLERRRQAWLERVADLLNWLAERQGRAVEDVVLSPDFESAVFAATRIALGQHVEEKLDMLKSVLAHAALDPDRGDLVAVRFLHWVEELEVEHVRVAQYASNPRRWHSDTETTVSRRGRMNEITGLSDDDLEMVVDDLVQRRIITDGNAFGEGPISPEADSLLDTWATPRGREWTCWLETV